MIPTSNFESDLGFYFAHVNCVFNQNVDDAKILSGFFFDLAKLQLQPIYQT